MPGCAHCRPKPAIVGQGAADIEGMCVLPQILVMRQSDDAGRATTYSRLGRREQTLLSSEEH